jgi:hypothetical protein
LSPDGTSAVALLRQRASSQAVPAVGWAALAVLLVLVGLKLLLYVAAAYWSGGVSELCQWDCKWYVHTAEYGYDREPNLYPYVDFANWAFFPLYPLLARLAMALTGLSGFWGATLVSVLCFTAFAVLSTEYRRLSRPGSDKVVWLGLLLVYPYSLYFFMAYTESLYLLISVLLLLAVQRRADIEASVATALLTVTRPTGLLVIPYLAAAALWRSRALFGRGPDAEARRRGFADLLFPLAVMPLGLACYMAYLYWLTGDALAFQHVQAAWGRTFTNPLKTFYWELHVNDWAILLSSEGPESRSYNVAFAIPVALGCAWLLLRRLPFEAWLLGCTAFLALGTGSISFPRIVAANPVFLLLAGDVADRIGSRPARWTLALLCVALQAVLLHRWLLGSRLVM